MVNAVLTAALIALPCIFVEADLAHMAEAFRTLGRLLDREERGEKLAALVEETLTMAEENSAAPEEMPTRIPSERENWRPYRKASSLSMGSTSS